MMDAFKYKSVNILISIIILCAIQNVSSLRNIQKIVHESNNQYDGGILYNIWIDNGIIYGNSYGIDLNSDSSTPILPTTDLITPNTAETCISISADYIYSPSIQLMFTPINIILAASCKICTNHNCHWRIITMNLEYVYSLKTFLTNITI